MSEGNQLYVRDRAADAATQVAEDGGLVPFFTMPLVDDTNFFSDGRSIYTWKPGVGLSKLISSPTAAEHDIGTDGTVIVWLESKDSDLGSDGKYSSATLYTSPYATISASIVPIAVTTVACPYVQCILNVSEGTVFVYLNSSVPTYLNAEIIRLSDITSWGLFSINTATYKEQFQGVGAGFVAENKLWIEWAQGASAGIQRIDLDALPKFP